MSEGLQRLESQLQQRTAQLESAERELESLSFSVSHDLRAPLRAIAGFAELLDEGHAESLGPEGRRYLQIIREQTARLENMMGGLVSYSRLGRQPMHPAAVDMKELVTEVFAQLRGQEPARTIQFRLGDLPSAHGDRSLLQVVWTHLLANALKFTRPKPVGEIAVEGTVGSAELLYSVRDNGVGFDPRYAERLFGMFQKMHREGAFEGVGAGLAITQRIVHRHGGRIWASAQPDQGATFSFTLPLGGSNEASAS